MAMVALMSQYLRFSSILLGLTMTSCGIKAGNVGATLNDPVPAGVLIAQGQFFGTAANGQSISGAASIYFSSGENILRLQGISFPTESNMVIQVIATNSQQVASFILRGSTGNQNYSFSSNSQVKFSQIVLYSNTNQQIYSTAQLQQTSG